MITGQLDPSGGDVITYGASIKNDLAASRRLFGLCPQHSLLFETLTPQERLC